MQFFSHRRIIPLPAARHPLRPPLPIPSLTARTG